MKKSKLFLLLLIFILIAIFFFIFYYQYSPNQPSKNTENQQIGSIVEFTGVLKDFDDRCAVDISCIAYVDNKEIITNPGDIGYVPKLGKSDIWNADIGSTVEVRAIKTGVNKYTLVGDDSLYVKIVNN